MVGVALKGSCSGTVGILNISTALIQSSIIACIAPSVLIKTRQRFSQAAAVEITKYKHWSVRFVLEIRVNTL